MDEPGPLKAYRGRLALLSGWGYLLLLAAAFYACTSSESKFIPSTPPASLSELVKSVAHTRGLEPKEEIKLPRNTIPADAPAAAPMEFYNGARLVDVERAYKIIGLLPNARDFAQALTEFYQLERSIAYDPRTSTVSWTANALRMGAPLASLDAGTARDFAPVVGIVQALQEQHFRWRASIDKVPVEDRRAAFRALAAGDALLTLLNRNMKKEDAKALPARLGIGAQIAGELDELASGLPDFLRRQLTLPYRHGSQFVYWAFSLNGWNGVNGLYANPPLSTAEILHPEKYFVKREAPLRYFPAQLLRRFKEGAAVEQTLGADAIAGLLARDRAVTTPLDITSGWRGDQLFTFLENNIPTIIWFISWGSETQAREFLRSYRSVLQARHRIRFDSPTGQINGPFIAQGRDQRGWLLQANASVVLLASTAPASRLTDLAADAWKDLEIDNETMEMRFESAQARAQLSVRSR